MPTKTVSIGTISKSDFGLKANLRLLYNPRRGCSLSANLRGFWAGKKCFALTVMKSGHE